MEALRRLRGGEAAAAIAASLGVAPNTVYAWGKLARESGKAALKSVPNSGRPVKLAREHRKTLKRMVLKLRDELLNGEIFYWVKGARVLIEMWRKHDNTVRPHSSLGYRPPAPEAIIPAAAAGPTSAPLRSDQQQGATAGNIS